MLTFHMELHCFVGETLPLPSIQIIIPIPSQGLANIFVEAAKREEFLRATMKICLVVSPPNSKLQVSPPKSVPKMEAHGQQIMRGLNQMFT